MNTAIIKEINKEYIKAVELYEENIKNSAFVENYINLAFLYWCFAFEQFNFPNKISEKWSIIGGNRYAKILELGLEKYPTNIELNFWKKYFSHIIYGLEFSENDCQQLVEEYEDNESLVPYFFLYLYNRQKYELKKTKLLEECIKQPTAKNIYIRSILEGN